MLKSAGFNDYSMTKKIIFFSKKSCRHTIFYSVVLLITGYNTIFFFYFHENK